MKRYQINNKVMGEPKLITTESILEWLRTQLPIHSVEISEGYFTFKISKIDRVFVIDELFLSCSFLAKKSEQAESGLSLSLFAPSKNNYENYFPISELIESKLKERFL